MTHFQRQWIYRGGWLLAGRLLLSSDSRTHTPDTVVSSSTQYSTVFLIIHDTVA